MCPTFLPFCLLVAALASGHVWANSHKTIYQKIQNESDYSTFRQFIRSNSAAIRTLKFSPLTVFVPENQAFDLYDREPFGDLAFYHMTFEVKTLMMFRDAERLSSMHLQNPPLWITKIDEDVYVNNAKILKKKSNYVSRSRSGDMGQIQVLHLIDRVLDPMIKSSKSPPTASDFLQSDEKWNLGGIKTVTKFYQRARDNKLLHLFERDAPGTFFVPVDSGVDANKYKMIDERVIRRHVVLNQVLFTRPLESNPVNVTDSDSPFTLSIERQDEKLVVKYNEDGEESSAKIVTPNIPLRNGVLHLISQPLGNFKTLKPFPYLPIIEKITNDPEIDIFFKMGSLTKFNKKFTMQNVNFTYFVPKDSSWAKTSKLGLEPVDSVKDILSRHLVISETPYSMQQLASMSKGNAYNDIELISEGGPLRITVLKEDEGYILKWNKKYIRVVTPDYECTNGLVHILSGPMVNFRRQDDNTGLYERYQVDRTSLSSYWEILKDIVASDEL